ncbi:hypothetical protein HS041_12050 [Planomonospora sp. ID67723]|uniref:hypothetical protein n=1 Tax=Planomonospora sp. ID67723 TaxID=2738134 RepID=UPI0018C41F3A|nr:hypothetical protein [Planomonospora sp. ID67723]MBG0828500.1 hypothetical protein [Planomonospora sp. ID67723]
MTTTEAERLDGLRMLRAPFREDQIGKLPRVYCKDCSNPKKHCTEPGHRKERCGGCNAYVSNQHRHIDYVGHADATERLLEVDPLWSWEPFALGEDGLPAVDTDEFGNPVGMWIRLTVCGMTRPGYGSVPSNQHDAVKVLIGDAIRNAAMRFGVALDLWKKGEREDPASESPIADAGRRAAPARQAANARIIVDSQWVEVFEKRLAEATKDNVTSFRQDVVNAMRGDRIDSVTANRLMAAIEDKQTALHAPADGLPRNQDGTIARSKVTDEQLAAVGTMTGPQKREHNKLVKDVTSNPQPVERSTEKDNGGPWATDGAA